MSDTSGPTLSTPFAFCDPPTWSPRMSQGSLLSASTESSVTLPPSGSMRNGRLYERPTLGHATNASGCSSLLGTPTAHERTHSPRLVHHGMQLVNQIDARLSTPTSRDWKGQNQRGDASCVPGAIAALLPTPAVNDMGEGKTVEWWDEWTAKMQEAHGNGNGHGRSLAIEAQRLLPTPQASDGQRGPDFAKKDSGRASRSPGSADSLVTTVARQWRGATTAPPSTDMQPSLDELPLPLPLAPDD